MALPTKDALKTQVKDLIEKQSKLDPTKVDAIDSFANGLAELILNTIKSAEITGIQSTVTGQAAPTGTVAGTATQSNIVKLK